MIELVVDPVHDPVEPVGSLFEFLLEPVYPVVYGSIAVPLPVGRRTLLLVVEDLYEVLSTVVIF